MAILAIDFETANEARHSPCAVGVAVIEGGRIVERVTRLIRPREMRFSPGNIRVHGLRPADVADAPEFPEAMADILSRLSGGLLVAHNARFDVGVLCATLALYGLPQPAFSHLCTVQLARAVWPGHERYGLSAVAERLGIRFRHHDAGEDAEACARIALAASEATGVADVEALARRRGLVVERPAAPGRPASASSVAARAFRAVRPARAPARPRFTVRGSRGALYEITLPEGRGVLACTCAAGRFNRSCRHVSALLAGDVTDLVSDNPMDVAGLGRFLATG